MGLRERIWAWRRPLFILAVVLLAVLFRYVHPPFAQLFERSDALVHWVRGFGLLAPAAFILLYVIQIVIAPIPGSPFTIAGGYLFGSFWGTVYSLIGIALGACAAAWLARWLGRPPVERLVGAERLREWEDRLHTRSPLTWIVIFMLPVSDLIYYAAGISAVPIPWLVLAACIGHLPAIVAENWIGSHVVLLPIQQLWGLLPFLAVPLLIAYVFRRDLSRILRIAPAMFSRSARE